jgi:hypothetical protein
VREFFDRESLAVAFLSLELVFDLDAVRVSFLASFVFAACFLTSALRVGAGFFAVEDLRLFCAVIVPAVRAIAKANVMVNQARRFAGHINFMFYLGRSEILRLFRKRSFAVPHGEQLSRNFAI